MSIVRSRSSSARTTNTTRILVLCACLAQVTIVLDTTIIAVALPDAQADLTFADSSRQWAITSYTLAFGSLLLIGGQLSQVLGMRRAFIIGLAGFGAASLIGGFATSIEMLLAARAAQGVFAALLAPTNLSLMNTAFPAVSNRARAFALFGSVAGAGAAIGLVLGGALTQSMSWRACLYVNVPLTLIAAVIAWRGLKSAPGPQESGVPKDLLGLALGSLGMFALVLGLSRADQLGWSSSTVITTLACGILLLVMFAIRERLAKDPVLPLSIIADSVRASSYLSIAMVGLAQMGTSLYLTFYFQQNLEYNALQTGAAFLPMVVGLVVAAVVSTRIVVPWFGVRVAFPLGAAVTAAGFLWLSSLSPDSGYIDSVLGPIVVIGLGLGTVMAPAMSSATHGIAAAKSGLASAVANTSQQLGASLGVAFLSTYAAHQVVQQLTDNERATTASVTAALARAGAAPESTEGAHVIATIAAEFRSDAEIAAYASGFGALSLLSITIAIVLASLFAAARSGRAAR